MVNIPHTDFDIYPLNLGANPFGWTADEEASFKILDAFVAAGGNFIDTADSYAIWKEGSDGGDSERVIGNWLKANPQQREKLVIATKSGGKPSVPGRSRDNTLKAVDESLERLGVNAVDIFYYHYDDEDVAIQEQVDIAVELIDAGKIKHLALSNYSPARMREFFDTSKGTKAFPVAIQTQYNLLLRKEYEQEFGKLAEEYGVATFPYFSLASGLLTGKYRSREDLEGAARAGFAEGYLNEHTFQVVDAVVKVAEQAGAEPTSVALAWLLAKGVTAPIASVSKVEQLDALMAAAKLELTDDQVATLDNASAPFA